MDENKYLENIISNYNSLENELVTQLTYKWDAHGGITGGNREEVWKSLFERIIPKKFQIARGVFIIDSKGKCSKEVDLAIYDEQYTPYIFNYGVLKFIPIEAVVAVIECKSSQVENKKNNLSKWIESIDVLETSQDSSVRIAGRIHHGQDSIGNFLTYINTQTKTRPIKILCHITNKKEENIKGDEDYLEGFDISICSVNNDKNTEKDKKLKVIFNSDNKNLMDWYVKLNHPEDIEKKILENKKEVKSEVFDTILNLEKYTLGREESDDYAVFFNGESGEKLSLLSFIFQFNQLLMLINNPIFFPHRAYVKMFNKFLKEKTKKSKEKK